MNELANSPDILQVVPVDEHPPIPLVLPAEELRPVLQVLPVESAIQTVTGFRSDHEPHLTGPERSWGRWFLRLLVRTSLGLIYIAEVLFGLLTLVVALAFLAAVPVLNFITLGYLLEASACVARTGKFRNGFPGIRVMSRLGEPVLGVSLMMVPLWIVSMISQSAQIIDPDGLIARRWRWGLLLLTAVLAVHIVMAVASGGRLWQFVFPFLNPFLLLKRLRQGGYYQTASNAVWDFVLSLRLRHYFWLGLRGFLGGTMWLAPPITLIALGQFSNRGGGIGVIAIMVGWFGAFWLMVVLCYVPIIQVRFAVENRFGAFLEFWTARTTFQRAPWTFALAIVVTLAFALPLYLLKIETVPSELTWLPSLFFILFMYPARLLMGWAYGYALRCPKPYRNWFFRWTGWVWLPPAVAFYVMIVYFTQFTAWHGIWSLYEQHAFLLPAPFVGLWPTTERRKPAMPSTNALPLVVADIPLSPSLHEMLQGQVELLPWSAIPDERAKPAIAVYTYGHPAVNGAMLDQLPGVRVVSNFGVGVDHIDLKAAAARNIPVGNTPGVLDGATADMAFALLLAAGRRLVEGDRYARSPDFLRYDPSYMLGREIHGTTLGIIGLGRIGEQVARRARGFSMTVLYHNRRRKPAAEQSLGVQYAARDELLATADYVVLTVPLTPETTGLIGAAELGRMKPTAILVNVARGPVVDKEALTEALTARRIYAAALDVTDPEPLPRDHPLLRLDNIIITPHLGSATEQTRRRMAEMSVENLMAGLSGSPLPFQVRLS